MRPTDHEIESDPAPPNRKDACMVCDKIECECPPEIESHFEKWTRKMNHYASKAWSRLYDAS